MFYSSWNSFKSFEQFSTRKYQYSSANIVEAINIRNVWIDRISASRVSYDLNRNRWRLQQTQLFISTDSQNWTDFRFYSANVKRTLNNNFDWKQPKHLLSTRDNHDMNSALTLARYASISRQKICRFYELWMHFC